MHLFVIWKCMDGPLISQARHDKTFLCLANTDADTNI